MAWYRRALGLPAMTINWGYLGEVGYLARRAELGERLQRQGVLSFTVDQALTLLERAMQQQRVQVSVMRVEWSRWRGLGVTGRVSPRFAHLCGSAEANHGRDAPGSLPGRDTLLSAAPAQRRDCLDALLRDKVARVLGTSPERLDDQRPLLQLGIDSLMAVELRNWIEGELQVNLPVVELLRSPSLAGLVDRLADHWGQPVRPKSPEPGGNGVPQAHANGHVEAALAAPPDELLARVEGLSGEQVGALLAALLDEKWPNGDGSMESVLQRVTSAK
jgi:aryl carrier-like protein